MDEGTQIIAGQVADRMAQLRREAALNSKHMILLEALILLREVGEDEVADALFAAKKRIGDKLISGNKMHV